MFNMICDLKDPNDPQGRTYREVNAARRHAIPIGTLVELESGVRLHVVLHRRDCDQIPLYSLGGMEWDDIPGYEKYFHGFSEDCLKVISKT